MKSKFKKGQKVIFNDKQVVIDKVIKNPLLPIHQYTFLPPNDGFAVGEQSIKLNLHDPDLSLSDCFFYDDSLAKVNTMANIHNKRVMSEDFGLGSVLPKLTVFFKPSLEYVEWLVEYANGRLIIDVGCGQGHLLKMIKRAGGKVMGIEPNFDKLWWMESMASKGIDFNVNEILEGTIEEYAKLINKLGSKALLVFARPSHNGFVFNGLYNMPNEMEALYITKSENLEIYDDLGIFKENAVKLDNRGTSEDNEVTFSIKKS